MINRRAQHKQRSDMNNKKTFNNVWDENCQMNRLCAVAGNTRPTSADVWTEQTEVVTNRGSNNNSEWFERRIFSSVFLFSVWMNQIWTHHVCVWNGSKAGDVDVGLHLSYPVWVRRNKNTKKRHEYLKAAWMENTDFKTVFLTLAFCFNGFSLLNDYVFVHLMIQ